MNRIYWVRHGENRANLTLEFSHRRVDYPLTPKGVLQAQQTAEYFVDRDIHEIYSSPLKRTVETAGIIGARLNLSVVVVENLREIDVGELEGQPPSAELWAQHNKVLDDWFAGRSEVAFPGGEDHRMLRARVRAALEQIVDRKSGRNIIVVGHGGTLAMTLPDLYPLVDRNWLRHAAVHNCSITEILVRRQDDGLEGELLTWSSCAHLSGTAADLVPGTLDP